MKEKRKYLYVLLLEGDNYYIGQTNDMVRRLRQHKEGKGKGAIWTYYHKPVRMVEFWDLGDYTQAGAMQFENDLTLKYMNTYGIIKVRGGDFVITDDKNHLGLVKSKNYITNELATPKANDEIKKKYTTIKLQLEKIIKKDTTYVYVLELENGNFYINSSEKLIKDLKRHFFGNGSRWSNIHRPINLIEIIDDEDLRKSHKKKFQNSIVVNYMRKYGFEKVRGGDYKIIDPVQHRYLVKLKNPDLII